ncbi:DNA-binding helix-turn-helix protein [Leptospira yanagawae serovar Saopaulo str. Sao Paulo = ATCC 700523]|uniref:DNA-binding helix-turn-helix protein n=1 Tax=Leptospira yanagawae serovar Saopaulo str. Sao Paulo = ATCC 700523 TaxID=1249483 RepID=A0A5E8H958_9LEPT|nr:helix-turn-helix domain-containing protein [Leptospira yanagawae]EOQ87247.1 DNA-binding helix-turn-helix protein [Leptospira yanagawae serovar Saopaulo str. Sao Paulo = ATCC 700523]
MKGKERTGVWVPQWIYDLDLNPNQIRLYAEIVSLDAIDGCYASNEYFAKILRLKRDTISRLVSQLKEKGLLVQTRFDGRKRFLKPVLEKRESSLNAFTKENQSLGGVRVGESLGSGSEAALYEGKAYNQIVQKQNQVHGKREKSGEEKWRQFLSWMTATMSESTRESLLKLNGPEDLKGLQLRYWERWLATPKS